MRVYVLTEEGWEYSQILDIFKTAAVAKAAKEVQLKTKINGRLVYTKRSSTTLQIESYKVKTYLKRTKPVDFKCRKWRGYPWKKKSTSE